MAPGQPQHEAGPGSLANSQSSMRRSFEPQFSRSQTFPTGLNNHTRSLRDSSSPYTDHQTSLPPRSLSWNGSHSRAVSDNRIRPTPAPTLAPPRRLSTGSHLKDLPGDAAHRLPKEILILIFTELRKIHLTGSNGNMTCATCYMRDMCSLSLISRKWCSAARIVLYEIIVLVGKDSPIHSKKKFSKLKYGSRLKLLRRTLRSNAQLARLVKNLKVPDIPEGSNAKKDQDGYLDIVASVIMACPNLERLIDFHIPYRPEYTRLKHALSTRSHLIEQIWSMVPRLTQAQHQKTEDLDPFHLLHSNWASLQTLCVHGVNDASMSSKAFFETFKSLPSLIHLSLSDITNLAPDLFCQLPALRSLSLRNIPTLQSGQISTFASSPAARTLTSLVLVDMNLTSLPVLARIFSNLRSLQRFTLQQDHGPGLPHGESIFLHPYLASCTLQYLHWDILIPSQNDPNDATVVLGKAINANGFPSLRRIRAPCDYEGVIQSLCRPKGTYRLLSDQRMYSVMSSRNGIAPITRTDSGIAMNSADETKTSSEKLYNRSLRAARQAAQLRSDIAQMKPRFTILCEDWTDVTAVQTTARCEVGGYIGRIGSNIEYCLDPDLQGSDESLMRIEDLLMGNRRSLMKGVCRGLWNEARKDCEHTEREQWSEFPTSQLF